MRGALVKLGCDMKEIKVETGSEGQVVLHLQPGTWKLTVEAPGFALDQQFVTVASAAEGVSVALRVASATDTMQVSADAKYAVNVTESGMKMDFPLMETPQAITVVNRELMDAQQVVKLDDALKNVAGVIAGGYYLHPHFMVKAFSAAW